MTTDTTDWDGQGLPPAGLQHEAIDLQQRQVLLPARAHGSPAHARQEDRLRPVPVCRLAHGTLAPWG